jgi:hypothetical protein
MPRYTTPRDSQSSDCRCTFRAGPGPSDLHHMPSIIFSFGILRFAMSTSARPPSSRYADATLRYLLTRIDSPTPVPHYSSQLRREIAYRDIAFPVAMSAGLSVSRSPTLRDLSPRVSADGRFRSSRHFCGPEFPDALGTSRLMK